VREHGKELVLARVGVTCRLLVGLAAGDVDAGAGHVERGLVFGEGSEGPFVDPVRGAVRPHDVVLERLRRRLSQRPLARIRHLLAIGGMDQRQECLERGDGRGRFEPEQSKQIAVAVEGAERNVPAPRAGAGGVERRL
jgi:hypothetical protein